MTFETNPNWENIPTPSVGEIIALHYLDGHYYRFEVKILLNKGKDSFSGRILSVHTLNYAPKAQIVGGDILNEALNKEVSFDRTQIFQ
jgi:hypothetical protein